MKADRVRDLDAAACAIEEARPETPTVVLASFGTGTGTGTGTGGAAPSDRGAEAREAVGRVLRLLQEWLADERFAGARLALVTRGAVAADPAEDVTDLAHSAVWG
ncbi:hypothetical protein NKH77_00695 [Streptomyces sp. M19]